jgi:heme/copper-type cytochrome/quinol oxidase subunit 3
MEKDTPDTERKAGTGVDMQENVLPFPRRVVPRRQPVGHNSVVAMLIFVVTELMLFAGFISAFTITRAAYNTWPPIGQPRLPAGETLLNTVALLASGGLLILAHRGFDKRPARTGRYLLGSLLLGLFFVLFQGAEWVALIREGLTLTSSNHGAFFYLIVGTHGLHAVAAILALSVVYIRFLRGSLQRSTFLATSVFWYFVVGVWPVLYLRVYL